MGLLSSVSQSERVQIKYLFSKLHFSSQCTLHQKRSSKLKVQIIHNSRNYLSFSVSKVNSHHQCIKFKVVHKVESRENTISNSFSMKKTSHLFLINRQSLPAAGKKTFPNSTKIAICYVCCRLHSDHAFILYIGMYSRSSLNIKDVLC